MLQRKPLIGQILVVNEFLNGDPVGTIFRVNECYVHKYLETRGVSYISESGNIFVQPFWTVSLPTPTEKNILRKREKN